MMPTSSQKNNGNQAQIPKLTIEDIEAQEEFKDLSPEKKAEMIEFVYNLSLVLYHSHQDDCKNEKS